MSRTGSTTQGGWAVIQSVDLVMQMEQILKLIDECIGMDIRTFDDKRMKVRAGLIKGALMNEPDAMHLSDTSTEKLIKVLVDERHGSL